MAVGSPTAELSARETGATADPAGLRLALITSLLYLAWLVVFVGGLGFDMFRSDVAEYWRISAGWAAVFNTAWAPGFPSAVALVRILTLDSLPPLLLMWLLSAAFGVASVVVAYRLLDELAVPHAFGFALVYAVFPFAGMTGALVPVADTMALTFFLLAALAFSRQRWPALATYAALALLSHKGIWFALLPLLAITFLRHRASRPFVLLSLLPLAALWAAGSLYLGDAWWMFNRSARQLMWSPEAMPVFDGLVTSLLSPRAPKLLKGTIVLTLFVLAATLLYQSLVQRFWLGVAICASTLAMTAVLNQHEVWAVVRFGRLMVIPVAYLGFAGTRWPTRWTARALACAVTVGVITNLGFAVYTVAYFFRGPAGIR